MSKISAKLTDIGVQRVTYDVEHYGPKTCLSFTFDLSWGDHRDGREWICSWPKTTPANGVDATTPQAAMRRMAEWLHRAGDAMAVAADWMPDQVAGPDGCGPVTLLINTNGAVSQKEGA